MQEANTPSREHEGIPGRLRPSWDVGAISHALQHEPEPTRDVAHGPGIRYNLADGALTVELFPPHAERRTGIVRLSTADSLQEFYRQPQPALREDGLIFATPEHLITLSPTGDLATYRLVRAEGPEEPRDASEDDERGSAPPDDDSRASGHSVAREWPLQNPSPETEGQPRVTYSGRLGTDPRTKVTPKGRFVMEFPVAVVAEGQEKPDWKSTVVFDAKARTLDGVLRKGVAVEVVAYEHRAVSRDGKTGKRRERIEYYATSVTPKLARQLPRADRHDRER
jgi:hypothetical protein